MYKKIFIFKTLDHVDINYMNKNSIKKKLNKKLFSCLNKLKLNYFKY